MGLNAAKKRYRYFIIPHLTCLYHFLFIPSSLSFGCQSIIRILIPLSRLWGEAWRGALSFGGSILPWSSEL